MDTLVIPYMMFRRLLGSLRRAPNHMAWGHVGICGHGADTTWLVRDVLERPQTLPGAGVRHDAPLWSFQLLTQPPTASSGWRLERSPGVVGALGIGDGWMRGTLWGAVYAGRSHLSLDVLHLVGSGMFRLTLTSPQASGQNPPPSQTCQRPRHRVPQRGSGHVLLVLWAVLRPGSV